MSTKHKRIIKYNIMIEKVYITRRSDEIGSCSYSKKVSYFFQYLKIII